MQFIVRQKYLDELIELYGTPDIKVITGIRRSGKSVLLQEFITYLQSLEEKSNIVVKTLYEFLIIFLNLFKCPYILILQAIRAFLLSSDTYVSSRFFTFLHGQSW